MHVAGHVHVAVLQRAWTGSVWAATAQRVRQVSPTGAPHGKATPSLPSGTVACLLLGSLKQMLESAWGAAMPGLIHVLHAEHVGAGTSALAAR